MDLPINKILVGVLVLLLGTIAYRALHPSMAFAADGIDPAWDQAVQEAHASGKPTIVLFTADWCPACRALHTSFTRPDVDAELDHYYLVKVDLTHPSLSAQEHARKYGAEYIPLMIRFDTDQKETARTNSLPPENLVQWLKAGE
jgi:thiol:disulfide interchange protein DsbD